MKRIGLFLAVVLLAAQGGYGQEPLFSAQNTNQRLLELATSLQVRQGEYIIGAGDLLSVEVFDVPDLSREVRVSQSGHISLPLFPVKIRAGRLTTFQLEEKLAELLQVNGLVSHPQVSIFVKEHQSQPITIMGAVKRPTVFQAIRQTSLLEALSHAEGLADNAGDVVRVSRPAIVNGSGGGDESQGTGNHTVRVREAETITVRIKDLLESGQAKYNVPVYGGDIISVPKAGVVYVVGSVQLPGGFALKSDSENMSALKAIALARGFKGTAKPRKAVIIRKNPDTGEEDEIAVNLKKVMARKTSDVSLQANDILFVPDSIGKKALGRAAKAGITITSGLIIWRR